jgi:hypothetical protein
MSTIVTRAGKGSPLTNTEVDANFINLNTDKYQSGGALGTPASATLTNATGLPLATGVSGLLPLANGGTGTATPALVAGTNVTITGTWPNQTIAASGGGGSGTVTSVDATVPAFLSVSGGPITTSGTLAISYSGTALPIANGGSGQTTASAAFNALSPITTTGDLIIGNGANSATRLGIGASTYVLTSNGTTATWSAATGGGATGGGSDQIFYENGQTVTTNYSITASKNAGSFGPITINAGVTVTVPTGSTWSVV